MASSMLRYAKNSKEGFCMNESSAKINLDELENACREVISIVLLVCETELAKHNDDINTLPSAAMAVRESIMTFLALVGSNK